MCFRTDYYGALGFLVMFFAAQYAASGMKVAPYWLSQLTFYIVGELCLSPVALSAGAKLSLGRFCWTNGWGFVLLIQLLMSLLALTGR